MIYCEKHCIFYQAHICPKCLIGEDPYLRTRDEVASPINWRIFQKRGWVKNG